MRPFVSIRKKLSPGTVLFIIALFGGILYISLVFNDNLWVDEAFTAVLIRGSFPDVIRDTVSDTLPPFYNIFGKILTLVFGYSSLTLKLFSCLPMILLLFFGGRKLNSLYGFRTAFIYELFLISMPHLLHYAVEIRMYSWGIFACGMAALAFTEFLETRSSLTGLVLFSVFAGYVHHFALVSCGMMWLILLIIIIKEKDAALFIRYLRSLALFFILYLPGLILTVWQIKNASSYFEMTPLSLASFLSDLRFPFVTNITLLSAVVLLTVLSAAALSLLKLPREGSMTGLILLSVLYLTLLFGYAVSCISGRSIFTARYLVPSLSVFWLGAAVLAGRMLILLPENKLIPAVLMAVISVTLVTGYIQAFHEEYAPGVDEMKAFFNGALGADDACIIDEDRHELEICLRYYYPELEKTGWKNAEKQTGNLWLFVLPGNEKELDNAVKYGYNPIYTGDFTFDRYSFSLYKLEKK